MAHIEKKDVLAKLKADGPQGIQHIDTIKHVKCEDQDNCWDEIEIHLKELIAEGLVKKLFAGPGELVRYEVI